MAESTPSTDENNPGDLHSGGCSTPIKAPAGLWHGGAPGRRVGDWLTPPSERGVASTVLAMSLEEGIGNISQRGDRVYVTSDRELALAWAGLWTPDGRKHGNGSLYQVEVEPGLLELDEDLLSLPDLSFQAPRAQVKTVYRALVRFSPKHGKVLQGALDNHAAAKAAVVAGGDPEEVREGH